MLKERKKERKASMSVKKLRVGIVGYGHLGAYLATAILEDEKVKERLELAFVWNRSSDKIDHQEIRNKGLVLEKLDEFAQRQDSKGIRLQSK